MYAPITPEQEEMIIHQIVEAHAHDEPLTRALLRSKVLNLFGATPGAAWPYHFLKRRSDQIAISVAIPQEESRMNVTKAVARKHVQKLVDFVQNIHTELVFNLDEVGSEEWADRKPKKVFAPTVRAEKTVHHPVNRGGRRVSAIVTISMAGDVLTPLLIIHRRTIDDAVWEDGWRNGEDFVLR
jgi:hypothetical protein